MNAPGTYPLSLILLFLLQLNVPFGLLHSSNERLLREGVINPTEYIELQRQLVEQSLPNRIMLKFLGRELTPSFSPQLRRNPIS